MSQNTYSSKIAEILTNDSFKKRRIESRGSSSVINSVNFLLQKNAAAHHTNMFHLVQSDLQTPIFRRGQAFSLQINFSGAFQLTPGNLRLDFYLGDNPTPAKGTLIHLKVTDSQNFAFEARWGVRVTGKSKDSLDVEVKPPPTACVGAWMLNVVTTKNTKEAYEVPQHFYILFNPWCREDQVYMERQDLLNEYILNDTGTIYVGVSSAIGTKHWGYNQFFSVSAATAFYVLELAQMPYGRRGNPAEVSRAITRMGPELLVGNWTGNYEGGVSPVLWQTSNAILERFMRQKSAVKFGQCWVYAALTCTLCRAIGLPSRLVSCFKAAHDTERNLTLDRYYDMYDRSIQSGDSIWNFHCWNDVWMTRPDLPKGYGGWQAIDGTPQERDPKSGEYECGPASLKAIKMGEVGYIHNTMFIFTEVNADVINWRKDYSGQFKKVSILENVAGEYVITKAAGSDQADVITTQYKFAEGTSEERQAMQRAAKMTGHEDRLRLYQPMSGDDDDVYMNILPVQSVMIGDTLQVSVQVENRSSKPRKVDVHVAAQSVMYTGTKVDEIDASGEQQNKDKKYKQIVELAPNQKEIVSMTIPAASYLDKLSDIGYIKISGNALVTDSKQVWYKDNTIVAKTPELKVDLPDNLSQDQIVKVKLQFTNPLDRELTECVFCIDSNCMDKSVEERFRNVKPNETVTHGMNMTPDHAGIAKILAQFNAKNLTNVLGSKYADVA